MPTPELSSTDKKHDYSATLNLPAPDVKNGEGDGLDSNATAIPQRASLPQREPGILSNWRERDLYGQTLAGDKPLGTFVLHDGPPYSNGNLHLGHALNKILKDLIVKSKSMSGYKAPYVPGWDNHGLPIETAVTKEFREQKVIPTPLELRKRCREYAREWVDTQREQFERLGVNGDWQHPYLTMTGHFEAEIVAAFRILVERGFIYRGLKPVHWCPTDRTALADAEIEYADRVDQSIFVAFPLAHDAKGLLPDDASPQNTFAVAWTTTPWTIPANVALAVNPEDTYGFAEVNGNYYLVSANFSRFSSFANLFFPAMMQAGSGEVKLSEKYSTFVGKELEGLEFKHPLYNRLSPIVTADYVTDESGTGIVHTAPGHGREDFETGEKYGLEVLSPVDDSGRFTAEAGPLFEGQTIWEGNTSVIEALKAADALVGQIPIDHSYPHCWRCHNPVIFRATRQWFMSIDHDGHRERCLAAIENDVVWFPKESINRITTMVANRPDWCLSRQRVWGVGIPVFYCKQCDNEILEPRVIQHVENLIRKSNSDVWFELNTAQLLPDGFTCPHCGSSEFGKETDIFDVWFDSGTTNRAVLASGEWPNLHWPADVYLEGGDQHRGWFNSSLMIGMATKGAAPFRQVVTNGWTLDEQGRKFSKSLGNGVLPSEVIAKFGADVLRLWVASTDYFADVRVGKGIMDQTVEAYRRLRNTLRFGLTNLQDFDPAANTVPDADLRELDRFALHRLAEVAQTIRAAYDSYEFHRAAQAVQQFTAFLSAFYFDVLKDTLYAEAADSPKRRSAQTAVYRIVHSLTILLAPIISFTSDEIWAKLKIEGEKPFSAQLVPFPDLSRYNDPALAQRWQSVIQFREAAYRAIETARQAKQIGKPLEADVAARLPEPEIAALRPYENELAELLLVSRVSLNPASEAIGSAFDITRADGVKCARCWLIKTDVDPDSGVCGRCRSVLNL